MATNAKLSQALKGNTNAAKHGPNSPPPVGGAFANSSKLVAKTDKLFGGYTKTTSTNSMETPQAYEKRLKAAIGGIEKEVAKVDKQYIGTKVTPADKKKIQTTLNTMVTVTNSNFNEKNSQYSKGRRDAPARLKEANAKSVGMIGKEPPPRKPAPAPKKFVW